MNRLPILPALAATFSAALAALLLATPAPASAAGILDTLFGSESSKPADTRRRSWTINEYSAVRIVPREAGSVANQHPLNTDRETLRQALGQLRFAVGDGTQTLFANDELGDLLDPITQALANAGPDDDIVVLSTSRRGGGLLVQPLAVTARLFVRDGALQFIAHDARYEFYNEMRGSNRQPTFTFGSRAKAGSTVLRSGLGTSPRPDWVALPTQAGATPAPAPAAAPRAAAVAPAAVAAPAAVTAPVPAPAARDANFGNEVEQRLITLKRLRDKGLISEDEYQQKRREILSQL